MTADLGNSLSPELLRPAEALQREAAELRGRARKLGTAT
jgi:hypothetical protein